MVGHRRIGVRSRYVSPLALLMAAAVGGCGGSETKPVAPSEPAAAAGREDSENKSSSREPAAAPGGESGESVVRTDAQGRKWIGNVPLDVWFDDPLGVAANRTDVAASTVTTPAKAVPETPSESPMPEKPEPSSSGADWKSIVPAAAVDAEVKTIRNELVPILRSLGRFNSADGFPQVQWNGGALAALAIIAQQHPDPVLWRENAKYVREIGTTLNEVATERGREAFDAAQIPFEQLQNILSGSTPADLPADVPETVPLGEAADRFGVMRRMDKSFQFLRKNVNTAQVLGQEKDAALQEAAILTALAKAISDKSYTSADEEEYATAARGLVEAGLTMQQAAQADDFSGFSAALGEAEKRCNECHQGYRFADF